MELTDLKTGVFKGSRMPLVEQFVILEDRKEEITKHLTLSSLITIAESAWETSNQWSKLLPKVKIRTAKEFLTEASAGRR